MKHLDLFSGIGGFALAAQNVWGQAHEIVSFCEIDKYCQKVLKKHWPAAPYHEDIKTLKGDDFGTVDLITGGFPCQPFSCAGKQGGKDDDRFLWPEMLRVISEAKPTWVIGENVAGFVNMEFDQCATDLENEGYEVQAFIIPACGVDAKHKRNRVWIIANCISVRRWPDAGAQPRTEEKSAELLKENGETLPNNITKICGDVAYSPELFCNDSKHKSKCEIPELRNSCSSERRKAEWPLEPRVDRVANGIPSRVDRLKGLGNAIVPQVVMPIMQAIKDIS